MHGKGNTVGELRLARIMQQEQASMALTNNIHIMCAMNLFLEKQLYANFL